MQPKIIFFSILLDSDYYNNPHFWNKFKERSVKQTVLSLKCSMHRFRKWANSKKSRNLN